ncbi:MAG: hypothetical protein E7459_09115 [Ruminococcaceae bacterium]|nr:hypothetical protein [Oscillospiraceae bacterium]
MKKIIAMILVIVLCCAVSVGLTVAYLTDRDSAANIFTVGNVAIDLTEDFEQGATLIPGVNIEKKPVITNTGNTDAWVWLTFAIPSALDNFVQGTEQGSNENIIHWNPLGATTEGYVTADRVNKAIADGNLPEGITADEILTNNMTWNVFNSLGAGENVFQQEINGVKYNVYVLLYNKALQPGETTLPNIYKVFLDATVDIAPNGDWYKVVAGNATKLDWNSNTNGNPVIYVNAYGMQKDNFATVREAYDAYVKQWGALNGEYTKLNVVVAEPKSGATRPAGYEPNVAGETITGLVVVDNSDENTNLRALYREGGVEGSVTVKDSVLDGTYAMNLTVKNGYTGNLVCENTAFNGWTSYSGFTTVTFTDCTFRVNSENTYNFIRPYDTTTFTGCEFKGTQMDLDDAFVAEGGKITLVNCTFNGELITAENVTDLLDNDAEVSSIIINNN